MAIAVPAVASTADSTQASRRMCGWSSPVGGVSFGGGLSTARPLRRGTCRDRAVPAVVGGPDHALSHMLPITSSRKSPDRAARRLRSPVGVSAVRPPPIASVPRRGRGASGRTRSPEPWTRALAFCLRCFASTVAGPEGSRRGEARASRGFLTTLGLPVRRGAGEGTAAAATDSAAGQCDSFHLSSNDMLEEVELCCLLVSDVNGCVEADRVGFARAPAGHPGRGASPRRPRTRWRRPQRPPYLQVSGWNHPDGVCSSGAAGAE